MRTLPFKKNHGGFTLVEVMVSVFILLLTISAALMLFLTYRHTYVVTQLARNTSSTASAGLERIVYGAGTNAGLRAAMQTTVVPSYPFGGWRLDYNTNRFLVYNPGTENIMDENGNVMCDQLLDSTMTMTNQGCSISLTVRDTAGGHISTNTFRSFVQFRN